MTDAESVRRAAKDCDRVFHMAALVRTWARDRREFDRVNIGGFRNVMDASLAEGV